MKNFDLVAFISNILAVILGIVITFSIQGIIDRNEERKNVSSALALVRDELVTCRADLDQCAEFLDKEQKAAIYLENHADHLKICPKDSVSEYGIAILSPLILTLTDDALELLKTSSLFSEIEDNELSLKIIRAYDQCGALMQVFNRHENQKNSAIEKNYELNGVEAFTNPDGSISITEIVKSPLGANLLQMLRSQNGDYLRDNFNNIDAAVEGINQYLKD